MSLDHRHESLIIQDYIGTLHWVTSKQEFDSIITLYNYYGYAFKNHSSSLTDAEVILRFFNENGVEEKPYSAYLETGEALHFSVRSHLPNFAGVVSAQMIPQGRMKRLTYKEGAKQRPIATSYFVLYRKEDGHQDFSHELFSVQSKPETRRVEWATVVYPLEGTLPGVVVLNNRPLCQGTEFESHVELEIRSHEAEVIAGPSKISLSPGGSGLFMLKDQFPSLKDIPSRSLMAVVRGNNIEQPLSFHSYKTGDFNFHHF